MAQQELGQRGFLGKTVMRSCIPLSTRNLRSSLSLPRRRDEEKAIPAGACEARPQLQPELSRLGFEFVYVVDDADDYRTDGG